MGGSINSEPTVIVTVLEIQGGWVKLGFEGNKDVLIHRQELWERIRKDEPLGE